jgi:4-diphosphocytidyl-2-C-methyl-D-erythritol kinase
MVVFPNCKINLGLVVKDRRADGYHELETIFYPAGWKDVLEIVRADELKLFRSGLEVNTKDNICLKAYLLLEKEFNLPPVHIHLHKAIPMGAGLGGGSADGAFTLKLLNDKFQLGLSHERLISFALELGSDCPFFIFNKPSVAKGRGEKLKEIDLSLERYHMLIVYPAIHVSTAEAFAGIELNKSSISLENIVASPIEQWKDMLQNDFEKPIFRKYSAIGELKEWFYKKGALYASMSGSGSAVYGFFSEAIATEDLPPSYLSSYLPGKL